MKKKWLGIPIWGWAIVAGAGVGGIWYLRRRNAATAAAAANTAAAQGAAGTGVLPTTGYAATPNPAGYGGGGQLASVLSQLAATQAPATTASSTPSSTLTYSPLTSWQGAQDLIAAGQQLDYAPAGAPPGTYEPAYNAGTAAAPSLESGPGGQPLAPGTTLYLPSAA